MKGSRETEDNSNSHPAELAAGTMIPVLADLLAPPSGETANQREQAAAATLGNYLLFLFQHEKSWIVFMEMQR